jgi:hypothetical protein
LAKTILCLDFDRFEKVAEWNVMKCLRIRLGEVWGDNETATHHFAETKTWRPCLSKLSCQQGKLQWCHNTKTWHLKILVHHPLAPLFVWAELGADVTEAALTFIASGHLLHHFQRSVPKAMFL